MPNPLSLGGPPPIPDQTMQSQGNALGGAAPPGMGAPGPGNALQGQPPPQPAPSHAQTVAALRHFHAIQDELETLLANPDLGKSSIKSAIIDGATKLVASRIISPAQAVQQLGSVPEGPLEQRKWLRQQLATSVQAQNAVLDHHREATPGTGNFATETIPDIDPDKHMDTMNGVMAHYQGLGRG